MKIYNLGSLNIDYVYRVTHFVQAGETLSSGNMEVFPGGKGLNQSIALARAGAEVIHGGLIGADGAFLEMLLREHGVISRVETKNGPTGHAIIQVDDDGHNCILLFGGANQLVDEAYARQLMHDARPGDLLLLQNEVSNLPDIFEVACEKGVYIAFNPSPFDAKLLNLPLSQVKWWLCNEIEGEALFGSDDPDTIAARFRRLYPDSNLVLTLGDRGSLFANADGVIYQPAIKTDVVDTTAAGDTFTGFFLQAVTSGATAKKALEMAARAAAVAVSRKGASPSIPMYEELFA